MWKSVELETLLDGDSRSFYNEIKTILWDDFWKVIDSAHEGGVLFTSWKKTVLPRKLWFIKDGVSKYKLNAVDPIIVYSAANDILLSWHTTYIILSKYYDPHNTRKEYKTMKHKNKGIKKKMVSGMYITKFKKIAKNFELYMFGDTEDDTDYNYIIEHDLMNEAQYLLDNLDKKEVDSDMIPKFIELYKKERE